MARNEVSHAVLQRSKLVTTWQRCAAMDPPLLNPIPDSWLYGELSDLVRRAGVSSFGGRRTARHQPRGGNSLLQRARDKLAEAPPTEQTVSDTLEPDQRHALDEYMAAFEGADIPGLLRILLADASLEMPPLSTWFSGRAAVIGCWKSRILISDRGSIRSNLQRIVSQREITTSP